MSVVCELVRGNGYSRPDNRAIGGVGRKRARLGRRRALPKAEAQAHNCRTSAMLLKRACSPLGERCRESKARRKRPPRWILAAPRLEGRRRSLLVRQFVREDFDALHFRRLYEQIRFRGDLLRKLALEMGVAAALVGERVEYAKHPRPHPDREPSRRVRLVVDHRPRARQEIRDLLLLAGFGFELNGSPY